MNDETKLNDENPADGRSDSNGGLGEVDFYNYLREEITDLDSAKMFMWKWVNEMDQELPKFGSISSRALCAHVSAILEGKEQDDSGGDGYTQYLNTKYGPELYYSAWGGRPNVI